MIGSAGYIAERHMKAIKETGNDLLFVCDKFDVMGRIDSYFPSAYFYKDEFEFFQDITSYNCGIEPIDFISICTPNYLHKRHIISALRTGSNVICEKPLVLTTSDLDELREVERKTNRKVYTILQLRHHPKIVDLYHKKPKGQLSYVTVKYVTQRGHWYDKSWKSKDILSGGLVTNIGIHLFDMLLWIFGEPVKVSISDNEKGMIQGSLRTKEAVIDFTLSINAQDLKKLGVQEGQRTFREITVNGKPIEFTGGFTDLHTKVYEHIIKGYGAGISDAYEAIRLVEFIRNITE